MNTIKITIISKLYFFCLNDFISTLFIVLFQVKKVIEHQTLWTVLLRMDRYYEIRGVKHVHHTKSVSKKTGTSIEFIMLMLGLLKAVFTLKVKYILNSPLKYLMQEPTKIRYFVVQLNYSVTFWDPIKLLT